MTSHSKIRVLTDQTINKIAAGEVIENPSSVVKELVENALDAGASSICVEILAGGRQLIRVSDDGCGMSHDDALLCLERHATSKIRDVEDIETLLTMGFRGEAIPSIASISKFTLLTCLKQENKSLEGTMVLVDGGRLVSASPAARSPGTTIEVKSLFFNVPVRRKFQRSPSYDTQEIAKMITTLALGHPSVQFELISDQKSLLKTPSLSLDTPLQDQLLKRIESLLGKEFAASLCPLQFCQPPYELYGYIGLPTAHRPNKTGQSLFINQRAVHSPLIGMAIREGYGTMLGTNRYPLFVLHLTLPGSLLDVNVHPQKKEVRLRQEHHLKTALIEAVQSSLRQKDSRSFLRITEQKDDHQPSSISSTTPFSRLTDFYPSLLPFTQNNHVSENQGEWEYRVNTPSEEPSLPEAAPALLMRAKPAYEQPPSFLPPLSSTKETPKAVWSLMGYIMLDSFSIGQIPAASRKPPGGLCLIDQKAAYSRIYYERLLKQTVLSKPAFQPLLVPLTLSLSLTESHLIKEYHEPLNRLGFSIREFGEQTFLIDAFPVDLKTEEVEATLIAIVQDLSEQQGTRRLQLKKEERLALAASKASLPKSKRLSLEEAQGLIDQLFACQTPFQCPSGSPTVLYVAPDEIEGFFKK